MVNFKQLWYVLIFSIIVQPIQAMELVREKINRYPYAIPALTASAAFSYGSPATSKLLFNTIKNTTMASIGFVKNCVTHPLNSVSIAIGLGAIGVVLSVPIGMMSAGGLISYASVSRHIKEKNGLKTEQCKIDPIVLAFGSLLIFFGTKMLNLVLTDGNFLFPKIDR